MQSFQWHIPLSEAEQQLAKSHRPFAVLMQHGTMSLELFSPKHVDTQQPHVQDELYIILSGTAQFAKAGQNVQCAAGDVLFVEAGVEHRFSAMSDDFKTMVVFYGAEGGELPEKV